MMTEALRLPGAPEHPAQMRLSRIQVCNWGTLDGYHDVKVPRKGFLVTGGSGSGKSTLIDAVSAVLVPPANLRFNAAAQEEAGRGSGRTLVSYIRGAWRRGADAESGDLASVYLRPKATFSAIALTYSDGTGHSVTLLLMLYLRSGDNSATGVKRLHGIGEHPYDQPLELPDLFGYLRSGIDKRALKREMSHVRFHDSYSAFASAFRRRLGIASESAQLLLHRTLSAKSLSSLDQLFRDFMLDVPGTFAVADRAVEQFAELRQAHRSVVDVRDQIAHLSPLADLKVSRDRFRDRAAELHAESESFPAVQAAVTTELVEEELRAARGALVAAEATVASARDRLDAERLMTEDLRARLRGSAGAGRDELARELGHARDRAADISARRERAAADLGRLGASLPSTAEDFAELLADLEREEADQEAERERDRATLRDVAGSLNEEQRSLDLAQAQLTALLRHRSNIDSRLLAARELICEAAGVSARELPFAGELLDVPPEHSRWRPAIERVLSGFARTMLVPDHLYVRVAAAVDSIHLGARLVYEVVDHGDDSAARRSGPDSLVRKVRPARGPFLHWLNRRVATEFDVACVQTAAELQEHPRAVTLNGLIRRGARYEKDDRRRIDDPAAFQLGSMDDAKVEALTALRDEISARIEAHERRWSTLDTRDAERRARGRAASALMGLQWEDIDSTTAQQRAEAAHDRLERWRQEHPEVAEMERALRTAEEDQTRAQDHYDSATGHRAVAASIVAALENRLAELARQAISELDEAAARRIRERLSAATRRLNADNVQDICQLTERAIATEQASTAADLQRVTRRIDTILASYLELWPAKKSDLRPDSEFVGEAVEWLVQLRRDRLAEFEDRFLGLIGDMQTRNLGELARRIRRARSEIETKIGPVNDSLRRSEFQSGRWLQIQVRDRRSETVTDFLGDLEKSVSGALDKRTVDAAEAGFAVMSRILDRLGSAEAGDQHWRKTVLDTRRHVGFIGVEVDESGAATNYHDSSSGLSGGQAQKLVFFCLAAALRFQLAEVDDDVPRYGTVVLDEAFDRADPDYTRRAMDVFTDFGFHMVLATPLKLLQTLEPYIGGLVVVGNEDGSRSRIERVTWDRG
ncbi:ATP-binding protein [Dietzia sp. WMMA184]|uniref:ATP-binding protein n=1 Tax=Dietzia sp. WMMA184 TaxID=2039808 RepID=UPI000BDF6DAC|nr:ATP-binding protein [Dietzia sp. WMMA184]